MELSSTFFIFAILLVLLAVVVLLIVLLVQLAAVRKAAQSKDTNALLAEQRALDARNAELEITTRLLRENREEQANSLSRFEESVSRQLGDSRESMNKQLLENRESINNQLGENREVVERRLALLQESNEKRLEQMRLTVDEKLTQTVEKRFAESFTLISERLEQVHKGLGEMQKLAGGVDDLRKVLSGVKTRGTLGEYQLGSILDQVLSPEQFIVNAAVRPRSQERVEFAVKIPSKSAEEADLLLPIDSKFPLEDYERLLLAYEGEGDETVAAISQRLTRSIKSFAREIRDKYINPPTTTDFAIMFVPTEGLYAEILRSPGLFEELQRVYHVTVVGPTNQVAFLSSLQMGFRTLAVEKRTSEIWKLLGAVKTEFSRYESLLEGVQKKLDLASKEMGRVSDRTRIINRRLNKVQELPGMESDALLGQGDDLPEGSGQDNGNKLLGDSSQDDDV